MKILQDSLIQRHWRQKRMVDEGKRAGKMDEDECMLTATFLFSSSIESINQSGEMGTEAQAAGRQNVKKKFLESILTIMD